MSRCKIISHHLHRAERAALNTCRVAGWLAIAALVVELLAGG